MLDNRFQNFLEKFFPTTDSNEFLSQNLALIEKIQGDSEYQREFRYYKALSHELRFQIYKLLEILPLCTCALAKLFGKNENLINHHLKVLETEGLVLGEQKGYFTVYRPNFQKKDR